MVHEYGEMENIDILKLKPMGTDVDTWIQSEIYTFNKEGLHINEQPTNQNDMIFETALNKR